MKWTPLELQVFLAVHRLQRTGCSCSSPFVNKLVLPNVPANSSKCVVAGLCSGLPYTKERSISFRSVPHSLRRENAHPRTYHAHVIEGKDCTATSAGESAYRQELRRWADNTAWIDLVYFSNRQLYFNSPHGMRSANIVERKPHFHVNWDRVSWRNYSEARGQLTAAQTLTDPVDVLNFFVANANSSTAVLSTCLRRLATICSEERRKDVVQDERFQQLVRVLETRVDDCDARMLTQVSQALYSFRKHTDAILELGRRVSEVIIRRENAFSPKNLASLVFAFSWLRLENTVLNEFLLTESMKLLAEMEPTDVVTLLEGFRRLRVGSRDTINLLLEKLTDDVDRFTGRDVVALLKAMSSAGTARGFLLRRVATLAFDNLESFQPRQLASIMCSLTRLRFATPQNCDEILALLRPALKTLPLSGIYETLEALTLVNYPEPEPVRECVDLLWELGAGKELALTYAVACVYAIFQFQLFDKNEIAKNLLEAIFKRTPPEGKMNNLKMAEVIVAVDQESTIPKADVPAGWRAAVEQASRSEVERVESSGLHNEIMLLLDSLRGKYQLQIQRNQQAGPYWVEFFDEESNICIDVDNVYSPTVRILKFRHLKELGFYPVLIDSWQWRRLRSEADQIIFLKQQLSAPLLEMGRLEGDLIA